MAATSAQIEEILDLTGVYSLITGAVTLTDNSAWSSIGVATPDTAKILLLIYDSAGNEFYRNAGWNAGSYTAPDLSLTDSTYTFTLPTDIAGDYLTGQYTIWIKCQVVEGGETTLATKTVYQNVSAICNDITISVDGGVVAGTTEVKLTDNTNYKTYTALSRSMTLYPPPPSLQANQTGTNVDIIVYSGTVYTGVWTWKITSDVTYTDATTGASTTCRLTGQGTFNVQQSQLCKVLCLLEKYRTQFWVLKGQKNSNYTNQLERYTLAMLEYEFATNAYICGKSQTVIDGHVQKIYDITGIDPDCDCGCDDGTSQPLLSVTTVDGTDGTDGATILSGSGAPAGGTGAVGDFYIDTATGDYYKKTGASTWTFLFTAIGATGATGATGASGVAVLTNQYPVLSTLGTAFESLIANAAGTARNAWVLPANTLNTDEDEITIYASFSTSSWTSASQLVRLTFNGSAMNTPLSIGFYASNVNKITIEARLTRITNTTAKYEMINTFYTAGIGGALAANRYYQDIRSIAGLNFTTTTYNIDAQGDSVVIGDITCEAFEVVYKHKV